jgi:Zn-dependent M16 (insulinase) family peptidase
MLESAEKDWPAMLARLERMRTNLLESSVVINLSGDQKTLTAVDGHVESFLRSLPAKTQAKGKDPKAGPTIGDAMRGEPKLRLKSEDEGFVVPTQVNFVGKGGELYEQGTTVEGSASVVVRSLSNSYLWDTVRVMGGAYGCRCSLSAHSGTFACSSYRDPNLENTISTYDKLATHLEGLKLDNAAIEQLIIGAVGDLEKPVAPASRGYVSMLRYLTGDTPQIRQKRRDEMFATSPADFAHFAQKLRAESAKWHVSVFGSKTAFSKANAVLSQQKQIHLMELQ